MSGRLAVIDTNVLVAGLITRNPRSPTCVIVDGMLSGRFPFLLSAELLHEYMQVLSRPRIRNLHHLTAEEIDTILTEIVANAMMRAAPIPGGAGSDAHLWALVGMSPGAVLVTGDKELLAKKRGALTPRKFLDTFL